MHFHLEIIMPPTDHVDIAIAAILEPFGYNEAGDQLRYSEEHNQNIFWDWYVIGGRWAGEHLQSLVEPERLDKFYKELKAREITVSGIQCGKQELQPADQIPEVDKLWCDMFPETGLKACPFFQHFNDQYQDNCLDVDTFDSITKHLSAARLIVAAPRSPDVKSYGFEAKYMLEAESWNGINFQEAAWDGNVLAGALMYNEHWNGKNNPIKDDWLVATVDYHN